ncbi:Transposase, MuDR, plant [Senna tora]|uniref:Transposase, MuDR, plant n=1 Tax=Senna tora TaxID=362788 RepID=A0A834SIU2_9FABA|nr:Transposase, MuDR, plant [Senna tora]
MDDNGNIDDNIDGTNEYDITEPPHEQLYTDSDRENDVNKYGIELGYWNGGEESERSVGIDEGESSASGSDVEKPEILNTIKNVKGKKFEPFFGLDGCHLKGPYGGVLLCAVSLDANNGLFPIAFAVVEVESKDSWSYFLEHLLEAIGDDRYIIMSDRQKGLTQAVSEIFSNSWHRHCMDGLRVKIMMRIYAKSITSWPQSVGPRIVKAINETIEDARFCRVKLAGRNLYEVEHLQVHHKLQLEGKYKNMLQYKQRQSHNLKPKEQKGENQASEAPPNPTTQESMTERSDTGGVANVF